MTRAGVLLWPLLATWTLVSPCARSTTAEPPEPTGCRILAGHSRWVLGLDISPDGRRLVTASDDQTLRTWEISSGQSRVLRRFSTAVTAVDFAPNHDALPPRVAVGAWDGGLEICDSQSGVTSRKFEGHDEAVLCVAFDPSGRYLASGSADDTLIVWDVADGEPLMTLRQGNEYDVTCVAFSPDGKTIVTGDGENDLKVWDAGSGEELETLTGHRGAISSVAFDTTGKQLVSASWDGTVRIWNVASGKEVKVLRGHESDVTAAAFSLDGKQVMSAGEDKTVRRWEVGTGKLLTTCRGHADKVLCLAVSPNGKLVASGSNRQVLLRKLD